jgi:serine/threonine protein kinase
MNQIQPGKTAAPLIAHMRELWQQGRPVDAQAVLAENPELAENEEVVFDVAFEEFCLRQAQGETLDLAEFAARFPRCESSLFITLECNNFVADDRIYLLKDKHTIPWPAAGEKLLGFELISLLGQGSFARVYLGKEVALGNRLVALKVSRKESAEAEILGRLRHDNIVPVYSIQKDPRTGFTVACMPFLGKTTLRDVQEKIFEGGIPRRARVILDCAQPSCLDEDGQESHAPGRILLQGSYVDGVADLGMQLAGALAFVHQRKIYHRDLKPSNILVRPDGRPMLLDFNLSFDQRFKEKSVGGTLPYMAPEHLRATDPDFTGCCFVDGRSDLYSLGVMLYELLAGEHPLAPFPEKCPEEQLRTLFYQRQKQGYRPLREKNPAVDLHLSRIVDKCLAPDQENRFQTGAELVRALRERSSTARRWLRGTRQHPRLVAAIAAACLGLAITLVAYLILRPPYPVRQYRQGIQEYRQGHFAEAAASMSRSLADKETVNTYLVRGRAYLKLGKSQLALEDFNAADKFQPSGRTKASLAYCAAQWHPPNYHLAVFYFEKAIENNLATSEIYSDLAYCQMQVRGLDRKALANLNKAIELDGKNQLAYFHRAKLEVDLVLINPGDNSLTPEGLTALRLAFAGGPASGLMHHEAARHYVLADKLEPRWKELALEHIHKAIQAGIPAENVKNDVILTSRLSKEPRFLELLKLRPRAAVPASVLALQAIQDPLHDFPNSSE